jgi:uncharacterized protein (UPF0276 family)
MYLAINYSLAAAQLVRAGKINIDYFKTPDWDWMIRDASQLKPISVHFTLEAGNDTLGSVDWNQVDHLAQTTHTPYINVHIDPKQKYHPRLSVDTSNKHHIKQVYAIVLADVMKLVDHFGSERIILENSPYRGEARNTMRFSVEPDIITRLIEDTGCGLLLDIPHAIIAAKNIGMDPFDYFKYLPTHKLKEMHFAGIHRGKQEWQDHQSIRKKDWAWLDWVLSRIQSGKWKEPWLLAFEYGGVGREFEWRSKPDVIQEQVPKLLEQVKKVGTDQLNT